MEPHDETRSASVARATPISGPTWPARRGCRRARADGDPADALSRQRGARIRPCSPPHTPGCSTGTSNFVDWVGCANERTPTAGNWNNSTDLYQFQGYAHGGTCLTDSDAYTESITSISTPLFAAPHNGTGDVFVAVNTSFSARAELIYQQTRTYGDADVIFVMFGYAYDLTHHSAVQVGYGYRYLVSQDLPATSAGPGATRKGG